MWGRRITVIGCLGLWMLLGNGCGESMKEIGAGEGPVREVQLHFESAEAFQSFLNAFVEAMIENGLLEREDEKFAIANTTTWSKTHMSSGNTHLNGEFAKCDADGNQIVSREEAESYGERN